MKSICKKACVEPVKGHKRCRPGNHFFLQMMFFLPNLLKIKIGLDILIVLCYFIKENAVLETHLM